MKKAKTIYVTGDLHGDVGLVVYQAKKLRTKRKTDSLIILGDVGINYFGDKRDKEKKELLSTANITIYCLRGNHEMRPQNIEGMKKVYSSKHKNYFYHEEEYPNIFYFLDWGIYKFENFEIAVIGGAYSIDKYYRLENNLIWFEDEQLTLEERKKCFKAFKNKGADFILSHTCPLSFQPQNLLLPNFAKVDNTMEIFLDDIVHNMKWNIYLFGHYHGDEIVRPYVEVLFNKWQTLEEIDAKWRFYHENSYFAEPQTVDGKFFERKN
jgi:3-oxoacid CoA-transferase subunit A